MLGTVFGSESNAPAPSGIQVEKRPGLLWPPGAAASCCGSQVINSRQGLQGRQGPYVGTYSVPQARLQHQRHTAGVQHASQLHVPQGMNGLAKCCSYLCMLNRVLPRWLLTVLRAHALPLTFRPDTVVIIMILERKEKKCCIGSKIPYSNKRMGVT